MRHTRDHGTGLTSYVTVRAGIEITADGDRRPRRRGDPAASTALGVAAAVADTLRPMPAPDGDDATTQELRLRQSEREHEERANAEQAASEPEQRAAQRRADKAAYLKDKLAEQADSER